MISEKKHFKNVIVTYLILSLTAIIVNIVYGLFGHGVSSAYMTWMFLYPLLGGALVYILIARLFPKIYEFKSYRVFLNCYNSGIATLTVGSFLKGILEIAGTNSTYIILFYIVGTAFVVIGIVNANAKGTFPLAH